jgi:membrane-associated PAP2 superfamily phosphatase
MRKESINESLAHTSRIARPAPGCDAMLVCPALALILGLLLAQGLGLDRGWADLLFRIEGGDWALRHAWLTSRVLHEYGQRVSIGWGVLLLAITIASFAVPRLARWRRGLGCLCAAVIASLLLVSLGKHVLALPCPWDLQRYGGRIASNAIYALHPGAVGGCFPAGHAAGGYCLIALYFFARSYDLPRAGLWLLPGLGVGLIYGLAQQLRGAHFLSHDMVSLALCWFVSYGVFRLGFGRAWLPVTSKTARASVDQ